MLLKRSELEAVKTGKRSLVFRRWKRPTVKAGGTLKTAVGVLAIDRVAKIGRTAIREQDAVAAGFDTLAELLKQLDARDGDLYRIEVRFLGADPRIRLREKDVLGDDELETIGAKLRRLDSASRVGAWTRKVLRAIEKHPMLPGGSLADATGYEKDWLKTNVRKLKNLGLTISHHPGYELSPRGKAVLAHLRR